MGALLVYDITKSQTFDSLDKWIAELEQFAEAGIVTMIVGNKTDLKKLREVEKEVAAIYAEKNRVAFMETSALTATNVDEAFKSLI